MTNLTISVYSDVAIESIPQGTAFHSLLWPKELRANAIHTEMR